MMGVGSACTMQFIFVCLTPVGMAYNAASHEQSNDGKLVQP